MTQLGEPGLIGLRENGTSRDKRMSAESLNLVIL
jgi:hypothetical protein